MHYLRGRHEDGRLSVDDACYALAVSYDSQTFDKGDIVDLSLILSACGGLVTVSIGAGLLPSCRPFALSVSLHSPPEIAALSSLTAA